MLTIRHIAEHAYCPRLFYFEEVEGAFSESSDTEKGHAVHQKVDSANRPADDSQAVHSLKLSSERLGVVGVLDLCEMDGKTAVPVEYRKGRPRRDNDNKPKPWPTDKVQLGLYSLLLEEAGYAVTAAKIYYASEKLHLEIPVDEALKSYALSVLNDAKTTAASGVRPEPLVNDPKCPKCSLYELCQPDEVNSAKLVKITRKLWPPHEDGIHVVAQENGSKVGVRGECMVIANEKSKKEVPLASVDSLSLLGNVQISTQAVKTLSEQGIPVAYLSAAGRMIAFIDPLDSVSSLVRRKQVHVLEDPSKSLELAKALIVAKITSQRKMLQRNASQIDPVVLRSLEFQAEECERSKTIDALRGHEGYAAAIYFEHFPKMLDGELAKEFSENGREKRPPHDPVNSCLSMAYSMLTHECVAALRIARLEPSIGSLHVSAPDAPP